MAEESMLRDLLYEREEEVKQVYRARSEEQNATNRRKEAENHSLVTIKLLEENLVEEIEQLQQAVQENFASINEVQDVLELRIEELKKTVKENTKIMKTSVNKIKDDTATKLQQLETTFKENAKKENEEAQGVLVEKIRNLEEKVEELTNALPRVVANGGPLQGGSVYEDDGNGRQNEEVFATPRAQSPRDEVAADLEVHQPGPSVQQRGSQVTGNKTTAEKRKKFDLPQDNSDVGGPEPKKQKMSADNGCLQKTGSASQDSTIQRKFSRELNGLQNTKEFAPNYTESPYQEWTNNKLVNTVSNPTPSTQPPSERTTRKFKREQGKEGNSQGKGSNRGGKRPAVDLANNDNHEDRQPATKKRKVSADEADGSDFSLPPLVPCKAQTESEGESDGDSEDNSEGDL